MGEGKAACVVVAPTGWLIYGGAMRITLAIIAAALAFGYTHLWIVAAIAGGLVWAIGTSPAPTKRVIVEDLETGKVELQPMDHDTQRYLNTRKGK